MESCVVEILACQASIGGLESIDLSVPASGCLAGSEGFAVAEINGFVIFVRCFWDLCFRHSHNKGNV